jgi:CheY-like chemotaxis protein
MMMDIILKGEMDGFEAGETIHSKWDVPIMFLSPSMMNKPLKRQKRRNPTDI